MIFSYSALTRKEKSKFERDKNFFIYSKKYWYFLSRDCYLIILASYYRQLSANIKMKIVCPKEPNAPSNRTGLIIWLHFIFRGKLSVIRCYVWLRTDANPADINQFRSHTGKQILKLSFKKWPKICKFSVTYSLPLIFYIWYRCMLKKGLCLKKSLLTK